MAAKSVLKLGVRTVSIVRGLIVHADDFGETEEITRGISIGLEAGVVTSTTIMANMPGTPFALREVKRIGGDVSFGLHLNLCEGTPLTTCPSLTGKDGRFRSKRALALRAMARLISPAELDREIGAQAGLLADGGVQPGLEPPLMYYRRSWGVWSPVHEPAEEVPLAGKAIEISGRDLKWQQGAEY